MKLITRGYGNNHQIITRGYGSKVAAIIEEFAGGAQYVYKETISLLRFDVTNYQPIKLAFHIGKFTIHPFTLFFDVTKISPRETINLLVHHFDIRTQQFISRHENVS
jgi:hypothetical protein